MPSANRQVPDGQPGRAQGDDDTAVEILDERGQVGDQELRVLVGRELGDAPKKDDGWQGRLLQSQEHREVGIGGDQDVAVRSCPIEDDGGRRTQ